MQRALADLFFRLGPRFICADSDFWGSLLGFLLAVGVWDWRKEIYVMSIKEKLYQILANTSPSFQKLLGITDWSLSVLWDNLEVVVQAARDGVAAIADLKDVFGEVVHDTTAQDSLAELLDEAIKFNAVMEALDGPIFRITIRAICVALAPFVANPNETTGGEVTA
jgi:hypothetical protein